MPSIWWCLRIRSKIINVHGQITTLFNCQDKVASFAFFRKNTVISQAYIGRSLGVGTVRCDNGEFCNKGGADSTPLHPHNKGLEEEVQPWENVPFIPAACRLTAASVHQAWHTFMIQGTKPSLAMYVLLQCWAKLLKTGIAGKWKFAITIIHQRNYIFL